MKITRLKEKIIYFFIPIAVMLITGLYIGLFYIDMFRLGTHFDISEIKIKDGFVMGIAKNVGSYDVESVEIVATLKENDGDYRKVTITLDPKELEVGEESAFSKEIIDYENIDSNYIKAVIKTKS